jgi:hypothetical protein
MRRFASGLKGFTLSVESLDISTKVKNDRTGGYRTKAVSDRCCRFDMILETCFGTAHALALACVAGRVTSTGCRLGSLVRLNRFEAFALV